MTSPLVLLRSLPLNLRVFGWRGWRLPILLHGSVRVYHLGRILIKGRMHHGMIVLGMNGHNSTAPYSILDNQGTLEVEGRLWLHHGFRLSNRGVIHFGEGVIISHNCVFDIRERLDFGHDVSVGFASEFTDSDMHFSVDVDTRTVRSNRAPIRIGHYNWLGSHTYVKKGTVTPDYTLVASPNALLCKDYTDTLPPYPLLGGAPARLIGQGKRRVYNFQHEEELRQRLVGQDAVSTVRLNEQEDLDAFCQLRRL